MRLKSERIADLAVARTLEALGIDAATLRVPWKHIAFVEQRSPPTWLFARIG